MKRSVIYKIPVTLLLCLTAVSAESQEASVRADLSGTSGNSWIIVAVAVVEFFIIWSVIVSIRKRNEIMFPDTESKE